MHKSPVAGVVEFEGDLVSVLANGRVFKMVDGEGESAGLREWVELPPVPGTVAASSGDDTQLTLE